MKNILIIAAVGKNWELGKNGDLLWKIPEDLKEFKRLTLGGTVVMGRKTWESLPVKPLPKRRNIILTRNQDYNAPGGEVYHSPEDVLENLKDNEETFIIGGGEIYKMFLPYTEIIMLTKVHKEDLEADTFFPKLNRDEWITNWSEPITSGEIEYHIETWIRQQ